MNRNTLLFALAAAAVIAAAPRAEAQSTAPARGESSPQTKEQRKEAWENGVKTDCAVEIAPGGVCDGKDFSSGLEKCLQENRKKLSDGCKAAVHPHHKHAKKTPAGAPAGGTEQAPAQTPAAP
jgi:hypothetical protein